MTTMLDAIGAQMQTLFIADSDLDSIPVFILGEPIAIPAHLYPACIIFVLGQTPLYEETGLWVYRYDGYIAIEANIPDHWTVTSRKATIPSYSTVSSLLDAATDNLESNQTLGGLVNGTETVRVIGTGDKIYGLQQRGNTLSNRGEIPFNVETQKPKS